VESEKLSRCRDTIGALDSEHDQKRRLLCLAADQIITSTRFAWPVVESLPCTSITKQRCERACHRTRFERPLTACQSQPLQLCLTYWSGMIAGTTNLSCGWPYYYLHTCLSSLADSRKLLRTFVYLLCTCISRPVSVRRSSQPAIG